tara:strand:+ start:268 stop:1509 length:1242 start_codon:yes stop_codon:yes gene_type:complete
MKLSSTKSVNKGNVKNANLNYQGEIKVQPHMFNPTQEDLDALKITSIRLFEDHYRKTTKEGEQYTNLSLLFEYNPASELGNKELPNSRFGTYNIAVSNQDLIQHKTGTNSTTGVAFEYWEILLIDERFNTLSMKLNENPKGKNKGWFQKQAAEALVIKNKYKVGYERFKTPTKEEVESIDLKVLNPAEKKKLIRFNPATCMVQKQGYFAYTQLCLNMSAANIGYFNPLKEDIPFNAKEWSQICSGDVRSVNKSYNTEKMYFYSDAEGNPIKDSKPKLGVLMYTKLKTNGYTSQETFSPSFPGMNSSWDATFPELKAKREQKAKWTKIIGRGVKIKTALEIYPIRHKVLGITYDKPPVVDPAKGILPYPHSFDFAISKSAKASKVAAAASNSSDTSSTTGKSTEEEEDEDDMPF